MKKVTTSLLLWDVQAQLLHKAAEHAGMNVSEYVREVLLPMAAKREGLQMPVVSPPSNTHTLDIQKVVDMVVERLKSEVPSITETAALRRKA